MMPRPTREISRLKLVAQITPHIEIEDVRLLRMSARVYADGLAEGEKRVRLRLSTTSHCKQTGTKLSAEVRFALSGIQEQDVAKKVIDLSATLELSYLITKEVELTPKQLSAFGKLNALYNAWPYWRELVQTTVARTALPRFVVPVFRIARPQKERSEPGKERTETLKP